MIERRRGHIVTLGSIAGRLGSPFEAIYSATKFAGVGLTEALVVELEPYGIGVSMVQPGPVATHFGEARGHPYDRKRPKAVPAEQVADGGHQGRAGRQARAVRAARRSAAPSWRATCCPPLFRFGSKRSFTKELAEDRRSR